MRKMKGSHVVSLISVILVVCSMLTLDTGCASIVPPTGGPRDTLPPVLVNLRPADSTRNFKGDRIVMNFDEFVTVDAVQKNLIVSPTPKVNPIVQSKLRTITITIKDTLEENTTYLYDFGNAIKDINEGNILRNYSYLFSTGPAIDSLELSGKVVVAETGAVDSTLMVMLHTSMLDSAVVKDRPRYRARLDSTGSFTFRNLAPGTYAIYALKDESGMGRYTSKSALFAFADSAVTSQSQRRDIMLYAYTERDTSRKGQGASEIVAPAREKGSPDERLLRVQTNASGGQLELTGNLDITFEDSIVSFDSSQVHFLDTTFKPLGNYYFKRDTSGKKVSLVYPWVENTPYLLILDTAFATDSAGRHLLLPDTIRFQTKRASEYGSVRMRFNNMPVDKNPVLQIVQNEQVKFSQALTNRVFYIKLFQPGEYTLRILYDRNKNGLWDPGQFFGKRLQPEEVQRINKKISIRANWDNQIEVDLPANNTPPRPLPQTRDSTATRQQP